MDLSEDLHDSVGSLTTVRRAAVFAIGEELRRSASGIGRMRNAGFAVLARQHNAFTAYAAFLLAFGCGARRCKSYIWSAAVPGDAWFMPFGDKEGSLRSRSLPMMVPMQCVRQIVAYRAHCAVLLRRALGHGWGNRQLHSRLKSIASAQEVSLLLGIDRSGAPVDVGTADIAAWLPGDLPLAFTGDTGRHYFASFLFDQAVDEPYIDVFLRHEESGVEVDTSTSMVARYQAWSRLCPLIDAHLSELGLEPLPGLGGSGG